MPWDYVESNRPFASCFVSKIVTAEQDGVHAGGGAARCLKTKSTDGTPEVGKRLEQQAPRSPPVSLPAAHEWWMPPCQLAAGR